MISLIGRIDMAYQKYLLGRRSTGTLRLTGVGYPQFVAFLFVNGDGCGSRVVEDNRRNGTQHNGPRRAKPARVPERARRRDGTATLHGATGPPLYPTQYTDGRLIGERLVVFSEPWKCSKFITGIYLCCYIYVRLHFYEYSSYHLR